MLKLVKLTKEYKNQLIEMMDEWTFYNNTHPDANTSPGAIFADDYKNDFDTYLTNMYSDEIILKKGYVPSITFFLYDEEKDIFLGACSIRKYLNESLLNGAGHIGDGIRPSQRKKGYGSLIVKLALEESKKMGIEKVMMSCNADNIASKKTIVKNGGKFDCLIEEDNDEILERYWIDTNKL